MTQDFVWDMSRFRGWLEQPVYEGTAGARRFIEDWGGSWEDWTVEAESFYDAGDRVVMVVRQRGRSKATGMSVEMVMAMVYTLRDGKQVRMVMYADPSYAVRVAGLAE
jgi:ketosteroid isomerase-like protein